MKRIFILFLALFILAGCLFSCKERKKSDGLKIVCTIFPLYDWTREIAGENNDVMMLIGSGVDVHSYQPSVDDIMTISDCDVFVYVGGESDGWVKEALSQAKNKDMTVINLMELLGEKAKEEDKIGEESEREEETGYDEHVWLSLENAAFFCNEIAGILAEKDPENGDSYTANSKSYVEKLDKLKNDFSARFESRTCDTLIICDRFPFRYLTDEFGFEYCAAFAGCSAETEASADTLIRLAKKADEVKARALFYIDGSDGKLAKTVRDMTETKDQNLLMLNSLQSVGSDKVERGMTYLSEMEKNLLTILTAVN